VSMQRKKERKNTSCRVLLSGTTTLKMAACVAGEPGSVQLPEAQGTESP
jgi:hypothetical protein